MNQNKRENTFEKKKCSLTPVMLYICFAVVMGFRLRVRLAVSCVRIVFRTHAVQYFGESTPTGWSPRRRNLHSHTRKKIFGAHQVGFERRAQQGGEGEKHPRQVGRGEGKHPQQIHPHVLISPVRMPGSGCQDQNIRVRVAGPRYQGLDWQRHGAGARMSVSTFQSQDVRVRVSGSGF